VNRFLRRIEFTRQHYMCGREVPNGLEIIHNPDCLIIVRYKDSPLGCPRPVPPRSTMPAFLEVEPGQEASRPNTHASAHRKEIHRLKQPLAEKTLEVDFFKGALQKIEARRQRSSGWRNGIHEQIREVMSLQGSLGIERMCRRTLSVSAKDSFATSEMNDSACCLVRLGVHKKRKDILLLLVISGLNFACNHGVDGPRAVRFEPFTGGRVYTGIVFEVKREIPNETNCCFDTAGRLGCCMVDTG